MPSQGMMATPEMGVLVGVRDGKRIVDTLMTLAKLSKGQVTITEKVQDNLTIYSLDVDIDMGGGGMNPLAMFMPSFAVQENYLVLAFSRADVKKAIKRFHSPPPGSDITANKAFEPYKEQVMKGGYSSISFTDWATTFEGIYTQITGAAAMIPIPEEVPIDLALLPTAETFTKHLFGSIALGKENKDGFHASSLSPFGPELLVIGAAAGASAAAFMGVRQAEMRGARDEAMRAREEVETEAVTTKPVRKDEKGEVKKEKSDEKNDARDPAPAGPTRR
jgi:hypothetical protein